ncbi:flavin-containing monooxygenase [Altererythrobacter sp. Z27]|uniref:flavin-containing monooxygenase n=1 Tax=Altererythrobacter sp. Z27 TaxID=3461147 RepID=UPI004044721A
MSISTATAGTTMSAPSGRDRPIAIIGAGASGMLAAIKLREAGYTRISIFEKKDDIGGTWRENRYPGLHCDVPSQSYCFSFALNPSWRQTFSSGPEIQSYFQQVAQRYGLRNLVRFNSEVGTARFDGKSWQLTMTDGHVAHADFVFAATGVLHHLNYPQIAGMEEFAGLSLHTGDWPDGLDLAGLRVGIIGTGATAAQLVPAIVDEVSRLTLFQRTAQWVAPSPNPAIPWWRRALYRLAPWVLRRRYRMLTDEIEATAGRWVLKDSEVYPRLVRTCQRNLETIADPELRRKLTPDYEPGCKRQIYSSTFYPAIQRPNATLCTEPINRIEASGVRTSDGALHQLDVLVYATGYRMHDYMRPMRISVEGGTSLDELWSDGEVAHRGVAIPGLPNFFMLVGPNSPLTNYSVIAVAEMQMRYLLELLDRVVDDGAVAIEPLEQACRQYEDELSQAMTSTVWATGCNSYYLDRNGRPNTWPWSIDKFRRDMAKVDFNEFRMSR